MKLKNLSFDETGEFRIPNINEYYLDEYDNPILCKEKMYASKKILKRQINSYDWRPAGNEYFYTIDIKVKKDKNDNTKADYDRLSIGNCFKTEKEALIMVDKLENVIMKGNS